MVVGKLGEVEVGAEVVVVVEVEVGVGVLVVVQVGRWVQVQVWVYQIASILFLNDIYVKLRLTIHHHRSSFR